MVADDPACKIELKAFHCRIINNHEFLKKEQQKHKPIPIVRNVTGSIVQNNYHQIKDDVENIVESETERLLNDPGMVDRIVKK
jgi:hypothetical protein